jgi:hypothetical protein
VRIGFRAVTRLATVIALLLAATAVTLLAGCRHGEEELDVVEGEPVQLGELRYNVQITRFLNPEDAEDEGYLVGQEQPPPGEAYLGVFLTVENEGDSAIELPDDFRVVDTEGVEYEPIPSPSPYALELARRGGLAEEEAAAGEISDLEPLSVPAGGNIPGPDTTAAEGPIGGAMLLFLVDDVVTENRPLELEIPGPEGETGHVELDI